MTRRTRIALNVPVSIDQREMVRAAAAIHGVPVSRWLRDTMCREAVLTLLAAQNRPVRLRPGAIVWAVRGDLSIVARLVARGSEKAYVVGPADVPRNVDPDGAGFVLDIINLGSGYLVARNAFRWVGRPFRKGVVEAVTMPLAPSNVAGERGNDAEGNVHPDGGGGSDASGLRGPAQG